MSINLTQQGIFNASGDVNPNLFTWQNKGNTPITLANYQNTGSFTQFTNCLTFDPSTTVGKKYTISFWACSPNGTTTLQLYNNNSTPRYFYFAPVTLDSALNTEWKYFKYTITNQDRGSGNVALSNRIEIYMANKMGGQVKEIKIEEGEAATPWVAAASDNMYVGDIHGFSEVSDLMPNAKLYTNIIQASNFIEW